jgi:hypothetical protein
MPRKKYERTAPLKKVMQVYEKLLKDGKLEPDGAAYSRYQKLKLQKILRKKYGYNYE